MVTWVPGNNSCTASAITWLASWRMISSTSGWSRVSSSRAPPWSSGRSTSSSTPSSRASTVRLARDGEMEAATSLAVVPSG